MPTNETWLGLVRETPIDPERPIVDPHHHLWDMRQSRYLLDELTADLGEGHRVVATVGDFLWRVTEPLLRPIRRVLPDLGGIDISPVILILLLWFVRNLMFEYLV